MRKMGADQDLAGGWGSAGESVALQDDLFVAEVGYDEDASAERFDVRRQRGQDGVVDTLSFDLGDT